MKKILVFLLTLSLFMTGAFLIACDDVVDFDVNFVVDGEVYASIGTSGNEIIKMPENPTKDGYTFVGWYWDKDVWNTPFTANSLLNTPLSSDMNVYAKFEHIHVPSDWIEDTPASYGVAGSKHKECTVCKVVLETEVIPALLQGTDIRSEALTVSGETIKASISNATETFSFLNDITVADGASYVVARDIGCEQTIASKTVSLEIGDNVYYILLTNGNAQKLYTVTIRRRPMYTVTFNTAGGSSVPSQIIEEGYYLTTPGETSKVGYTFAGWNTDLTAPITENKTVTAQWTANTNTPYKVEYYRENVNKNGYDIVDTQNLSGTTDTRANAEQKTFEHFTLNTSKSTLSGNINGSGILVLRVYYTRNTYTINTTTGGTVTGNGTYAYDKQVTATVTPHIGYNFIGWYSNNTYLSNATTDTFVCDKNIEAKFEVVPEMANFNFTSTTTTCTIIGIKDKTVTNIIVPDYVTEIKNGSFYGCNSLENITIPFIGAASVIDSYRYPYEGHFGYIFGYSISNNSDTTNCNGFYWDYQGNKKYYIYNIPDSLKSVTLSNKVTTIRNSAFRGCDTLTNILLSNNLSSIGNWAFGGCEKLSTLIIPNKVSYIGEYAFNGCTKLMSVTFEDTTTWKAGTTTLSSSNLANKSTTADYLRSTYSGYIWTKS